MRLKHLLGRWAGEGYVVEIQGDGVRIESERSPHPMCLIGARVEERDGEVWLRGEVSTEDTSVVLRRAGSRGLQLGWLDGIFPLSIRIERPAVARAYPFGDNRLLATAAHCLELWKRFGQDLDHHVQSSRQSSLPRGIDRTLGSLSDEAIGLVPHRPSETPTYDDAHQEDHHVRRLNEAWDTIEKIRIVGRRALDAGLRMELDRHWCELSNPAPYRLDSGDLEEAARIQFADLHELGLVAAAGLEARLLHIEQLSDLRYLDLRGNALDGASLAGVRLERLDSLRAVDLSHNDLRELPPGLLDNTAVRFVCLAHNQLERAPSLDRMRSLQRLDLRENPLPPEQRAQLRAAYPQVKLHL